MTGIRATRASRAVETLRDLILAGGLVAGERLHEVALAERLGLSRTPLRAALSQLAEDGLVLRLPSGGYEVRRFTRSDAIDVIELRGVLEGMVVRLAAERGIAEGTLKMLGQLLDEIDIALDGGERHMDFDSYVELNAELHHTLWTLAGDTIRWELERVARLPFGAPETFLGPQADVFAARHSLLGAQIQHRALVDAIARREGARAESIAREHARLARQNLDYVLDEAPNLISALPILGLISP